MRTFSIALLFKHNTRQWSSRLLRPCVVSDVRLVDPGETIRYARRRVILALEEEKYSLHCPEQKLRIVYLTCLQEKKDASSFTVSFPSAERGSMDDSKGCQSESSELSLSQVLLMRALSTQNEGGLFRFWLDRKTMLGRNTCVCVTHSITGNWHI